MVKVVKSFNFEMGLGYSFAAKGIDEVKNEYRVGFQLEGRYKLPNLPINVGLQLGLSTFTRDWGGGSKYRSFSVLPVIDYSFRQGKKINPFIGLGAGVAFNNIGGVFNEDFKTNSCIMPRVGVRLLNHITLSVDYQLTHEDYSHMNIRLGYYF